jgi:hypothetical protein
VIMSFHMVQWQVFVVVLKLLDSIIQRNLLVLASQKVGSVYKCVHRYVTIIFS